jgi:hypothetical protein
VRWPVGPDQLHVSDFGVFDQEYPEPLKGRVGPLWVVTHELVESWLREPVRDSAAGAVWSASRRGGRLFVNLDFDPHRSWWLKQLTEFQALEGSEFLPASELRCACWTWELYEAVFCELDAAGEVVSRSAMLLARWPD